MPALLLLLFSCTEDQQQNAVLIKNEPAYKAYAVQKDVPEKMWGYIIERNHHLIIQQFYVPALAGEQRFKNMEEAERVGNYVANKLNRSLHPSVTKTELDSLGIIKLKHAEQKK